MRESPAILRDVNFKPLQVLSTLNINIQYKAAVNINNCSVNVSTSMKALPRIPALRKLKIIFLIVVLLWTAAWISRPTVSEFMADVFVSTKQEGAGNGHNIIPTTRPAISKAERRKLFLAFSYGDQLTRATESLLALAAIAKHGNRNVVVPFVKDSRFYGTKLDNNTGTLSRYFDLKELNIKLDSYGYGLLVSWEHFQKYCRPRLDVLLIFFYPAQNVGASRISTSQRQHLNKEGWTLCSDTKYRKIIQGFEIRRSVCINPELFTSVEKLEGEVLRNSPCVGIADWRGIGSGRTHFFLPSNIPSPFSIRHEVPISQQLLQLAQEFMYERLGNNFISVHIRSEWVLIRSRGASINHLLECLKQVASKVQEIKRKIRVDKIFLATDFTKTGSGSYTVQLARKKSKLLGDFLDKKLENPETFELPSTVDLSDRGSIAIVEMSILSAGKKLFLVGGGSFEDWMKAKFELVDNNVAVKICYRKRTHT